MTQSYENDDEKHDGMLVWERMQPKYTETYARMIDGS